MNSNDKEGEGGSQSGSQAARGYESECEYCSFRGRYLKNHIDESPRCFMLYKSRFNFPENTPLSELMKKIKADIRSKRIGQGLYMSRTREFRRTERFSNCFLTSINNFRKELSQIKHVFLCVRCHKLKEKKAVDLFHPTPTTDSELTLTLMTLNQFHRSGKLYACKNECYRPSLMLVLVHLFRFRNCSNVCHYIYYYNNNTCGFLSTAIFRFVTMCF